ncbi:uncharacterized protein LOC121991365 [Zingiber officinale]|uniref:uncharacterized protein LOC121991365 n=1 Tax=Zingiber officinale TaxID=94328 RepID=UPI001C4D19EC|nr:uncharacterized protein LOC121991365 [Zingiber officinale]
MGKGVEIWKMRKRAASMRKRAASGNSGRSSSSFTISPLRARARSAVFSGSCSCSSSSSPPLRCFLLQAFPNQSEFADSCPLRCDSASSFPWLALLIYFISNNAYHKYHCLLQLNLRALFSLHWGINLLDEKALILAIFRDYIMGGHNPSVEIEKYDWSKTNVAMFVDIIYEKVKHNKLQTSTFTNTVWEEINKKLYQVTNKNYGVERLKGKWNRLRTRQRLFAALLAHTSVTMDLDTDKVNAPEEVWTEFYLKNRKEYKSIRKEGCDHFHILSEIFGRTTATGDMHRASTQLLPTSDEERELEEAFINIGVSSYVEVVDDENEDVGGEPNNRRHRSTESTESHRRKDPKRSKTEKYDAYMDKWSDTLQHLSQESIARQKYLDLRAAKLEREQEISSSTGTSGFSDPYSIDMCMQILNQMGDLYLLKFTQKLQKLLIMSNSDDEYDELGPDINLLLILSHANDSNCLRAIDGTHVSAWAPTSIQTSFRGRKVIITQNVMLVCDFNMLFTFVYTGWEGTANDSRVFIDALTRHENHFPKPCGDQFYLVDSGYPNMSGFLASYRGQRYHLRDYRRQGRPRGKEELFNYRHSTCRNIIERCIGVLKARFRILKDMPNYPITSQRLIPFACCAVHNFIRRHHAMDNLFMEYSSEDMLMSGVEDSFGDQEPIPIDPSQTAQMGHIRDDIASHMWNDYVEHHP